jgi:hypothetical protein
MPGPLWTGAPVTWTGPGKDAALRILPAAAAFAASVIAGSAVAEEMLGDVRGNWAGPSNDGFFYHAVLTRENGALRLRISQGLSEAEADGDPQFDNPQIASHAVDDDIDRAWIEALPGGALALNLLTYTEGYLYSQRLVLSYMDNQFTAMSFVTYNNWDLPGTIPGDPFRCLSDQACYSCEADLWNGVALAGGQRIEPPPLDAEALNASAWNDMRVYELGFCPAPD